MTQKRSYTAWTHEIPYLNNMGNVILLRVNRGQIIYAFNASVNLAEFSNLKFFDLQKKCQL